MRSQIAPAAALLVALAGCGGTASRGGTASHSGAGSGDGGAASHAYVSSSYKFDTLRGISLAIAPPPVTGELGNRIDMAFATAFRETPGCNIMAAPTAVRMRMNSDRKLVVMMSRILSQEPDTRTPGSAPSLHPLLTEQERLYLREVMYLSDMLLLPGDFNLRAEPSRTSGSVTFRVYDLRTGDLVLLDSVSYETATGGTGGERETAKELILLVQKEFVKHLLHS